MQFPSALDRHPTANKSALPVREAPVVPAVVTWDSDDYAALLPNLIDSRASTVGTLRAVSMAKLAPTRGPRKAFLCRNVGARFREAHFVPAPRNVVPI
jgi:hypothetical protein